jgi:hypothetical protein
MKLVKPNRNRSEQDIYHTSRSCPYVTTEYLELSDTTQPEAEFSKCAWCADDIDHAGSRNEPCPFCGEAINKLPDHLPCDQTP